MNKNSSKILSSLIVKFTADVQAQNIYFQVKFINFYLREIISFTKRIDIRDWGQSKELPILHLLPSNNNQAVNSLHAG